MLKIIHLQFNLWNWFVDRDITACNTEMCSTNVKHAKMFYNQENKWALQYQFMVGKYNAILWISNPTTRKYTSDMIICCRRIGSFPCAKCSKKATWLPLILDYPQPKELQFYSLYHLMYLSFYPLGLREQSIHY